jgi:hypothetical protein
MQAASKSRLISEPLSDQITICFNHFGPSPDHSQVSHCDGPLHNRYKEEE